MYKYIVYKTTNLVNLKIYIGVHRTDIDTNDGYLGCGVYVNSVNKLDKKGFPSAIAKYGFNNFRRETLFTFPDTESGKLAAYKKEAELVNRDFLKRKDVYNICLGGKVPSSVLEKPIAQYDLFGKFIKKFESIVIASNELNIPKSCIQNACSKHGRCRDFLFRYYTNNSDLKNISIKSRVVYQFDLQGNYLTYYKSCADAQKALNKPNDKSISAVCNNKQRQAYGFFWSYKKQFTYSIPDNTSVAVACYKDDGTFIESFTSLNAAEDKYHTNKGTIKNCICGKSKHAGKVR